MKVHAKFGLAVFLVFLLLELTTVACHLIRVSAEHAMILLLQQPIQETMLLCRIPGNLFRSIITVLFFHSFAKGVLKNYLFCGEVTIIDGLSFGVFPGLITSFTDIDLYTSLKNKGTSGVLIEGICLMLQGVLCGSSLGLVYKSD